MMDQRSLVEQSLRSTHHPDVYPTKHRRQMVGEDEEDQLIFEMTAGSQGDDSSAA